MSSKTVTKHKKEWLIHSFLFFAVALRILTQPRNAKRYGIRFAFAAGEITPVPIKYTFMLYKKKISSYPLQSLSNVL
jgi:hypothetical protein